MFFLQKYKHKLRISLTKKRTIYSLG